MTVLLVLALHVASPRPMQPLLHASLDSSSYPAEWQNDARARTTRTVARRAREWWPWRGAADVEPAIAPSLHRAVRRPEGDPCSGGSSKANQRSINLASKRKRDDTIRDEVKKDFSAAALHPLF